MKRKAFFLVFLFGFNALCIDDFSYSTSFKEVSDFELATIYQELRDSGKYGTISIFSIQGGISLKETAIGTLDSKLNTSYFEKHVKSPTLAGILNKICEYILYQGGFIQEIFVMFHLNQNHFISDEINLATRKAHVHQNDMYLITLTDNPLITTVFTEKKLIYRKIN